MIEREFAGQVRKFELQPANKARLYRGFEGEHGTLPEIALKAARNRLGVAAVAHVIAHALSGGHPVQLLRMRDLVAGEMRGKPLAQFMALVVDITADAYAGPSDGSEAEEPGRLLSETEFNSSGDGGGTDGG